MRVMWGANFVNIIQELRRDVEGAKLLSDWLGDGGEPVSQIVAEHRASVCAFGDGGYPCGLNREAGWWDRVKHKIADTIRAELEIKHRMALRVSSESALHLCVACGCCLNLAIWSPTKRLAEHTTQETLDKMPSWCWKKKQVLEFRSNQQKETP